MTTLSPFRILLATAALGLGLAASAYADWSFLAPNSADLYSIQRQSSFAGSADQAHQQNLKLIEAIQNAPASVFPRRAPTVTRKEAEQLFEAILQHPVASTYNGRKYDPSGGIGFCFGRAMTVHLEAIYRGLAKDSILKLFAVGRLGNWGFHVTTLVRSDRGWLAIDPIMGQVVTVSEWYARVRTMDTDGKFRIFATKAEKFGPTAGQYNNSALLDGFYNQYFNDLMREFRKNGAASAKRFGPLASQPDPNRGPRTPTPRHPTSQPVRPDTFWDWIKETISSWGDMF